MLKNTLTLLLLIPLFSISQDYNSFFTGNTTDANVNALGGICLMGGATENDNAMIWFLEKANGGDVLVLRASGSDGYNDYFFTDLGVTLNSVETIVFNNGNASNNVDIIQKINEAEAIWFAGGDQWEYISYWKNTAIQTAINNSILNRNIAIGGTSAGMAILGDYYFSAQNGTVTSSTALNNPFDNNVTLDGNDFISLNILNNTITDTHFENPDRKGRLSVFLSRLQNDYSIDAKAIVCEEFTAVCIDNNGTAQVFGDYPDFDDNAYFIQINCENTSTLPENLSPNTPLTWDLGGNAIKAYKIPGTSEGTGNFDLNDWQTGNGGNWFNWSINNGVLIEESSTAINCPSLSANDLLFNNLNIYPNPTKDLLTIERATVDDLEVSIFNSLGQKIVLPLNNFTNRIEVNTTQLPSGLYHLVIYNKTKKNSTLKKFIKA